jgi:hypothetical protein
LDPAEPISLFAKREMGQAPPVGNRPSGAAPHGGNHAFGEVAQSKIMCILSKIAFENLKKSL